MRYRESYCLALARHSIAILFSLICALLFLATVSQPSQSQTYSVIHTFTGKGSDGATPYAGPILDRAGDLYGTTYTGGTYGAGSVYKLSLSGSSWTYEPLYSFQGVTDGSGPAFGSLALGADSVLFGTTEGGQYFGLDFAVCACPGREIVVHRFGLGTDGAQPIGGVVLDAAGNFYGTTSLGGAFGNGTVYEEKRSGTKWTESVIYSFTGGSDPINPAATVTVDGQGNLYGTASLGGAYSNGAVYKLTRSASGWTETVLYSFQNQSDGANPVGGVILDRAGNLYGSTFDGGINGGGTIYQLSPSSAGWTFTTLYSFVGIYGGPYNKLTLDSKGDLYGITNADGANGLGSVFRLSRSANGWTLTDLYDFVGGDSGRTPYGAVAVDHDGNIFGTASIGGSENQGVIFEITP